LFENRFEGFALHAAIAVGAVEVEDDDERTDSGFAAAAKTNRYDAGTTRAGIRVYRTFPRAAGDDCKNPGEPVATEKTSRLDVWSRKARHAMPIQEVLRGKSIAGEKSPPDDGYRRSGKK
jgi:hypothetical protein